MRQGSMAILHTATNWQGSHRQTTHRTFKRPEWQL